VLATIASIISNIVFISWDAQIIQNKSSYKQTNNDDFNIKKLRYYNYDGIIHVYKKKGKRCFSSFKICEFEFYLAYMFPIACFRYSVKTSYENTSSLTINITRSFIVFKDNL
jgi:hypothetical protein